MTSATIMTDQTSLMVRNDAAAKVSFSTEATELRDNALAEAALIGKVANNADQERAVKAQLALHTVIQGVEKARKECKEPVLEFGRRIDDAAKTFVSEVKSEKERIDAKVRDYAQLEAARIRAEEQARNEALAANEREKARAMMACQSHEQMDAVAAHFNEKAAELPVPKFEKAAGQTLTDDWEITITDPWLLARAHPNCVKIVPVISEIKTLLKAGQKPAGVNAVPIVRAGVRLGAQRKAIEV